MWTAILTLIKNPKNILILVLLVGIIGLGGVYSIKSLKLENAQGKVKGLENAIKAYEGNSEASKKALENQQKIENNLASLKIRIEQMKPTKCLEKYDEKVFTDITWMFNNPGLSPEQCTSSKEGVPQTSKTCVGDTNWTGQQIARNYEELVKSYLQLEETVKCYEK
jgi:hypothetical protein